MGNIGHRAIFVPLGTNTVGYSVVTNITERGEVVLDRFIGNLLIGTRFVVDLQVVLGPAGPAFVFINGQAGGTLPTPVHRLIVSRQVEKTIIPIRLH